MAKQLGIMPPYKIYLNFLDPGLRIQLLDWVLENATKFEPTEVGDGVCDPDYRQSVSVSNFEPIATELRRPLSNMVKTFINDLNVTPFSPSEISLELVAHNDGCFFKRHVDTFVANMRKKADRLLSAVYYFHKEPKAFAGGMLRLNALSDAEHKVDFVDIEPKQNSLVVFPSWAPHEVLPIVCPSKSFSDTRFAVNCWSHR